MVGDTLIVGSTVGVGRGVAVAVGNGVGSGVGVDVGVKGCGDEQAAAATQTITIIKERQGALNTKVSSWSSEYKLAAARGSIPLVVT
jgi:hypothetical protein